MILRNFKRFAGLVGPLQTASYVQCAVFKEHYAQRANTTHNGEVGPLQTASYVQYAVFKEHYAQRVFSGSVLAFEL